MTAYRHPASIEAKRLIMEKSPLVLCQKRRVAIGAPGGFIWRLLLRQSNVLGTAI